MDGTASDLDRAATDLDSVRGQLGSPPDFTPDTYGEGGADQAAANFVTAWADEMRLDIDALHELADRIRQSASNYRVADQLVARHFSR